MAYIGQKPFQEFSSIPTKDSFTGDGSTTTFDLANDVVRGAENSLEVFIDNVRQEPGSGKAFTLGIDGSSNYRRITFSSAPANGASIYVINDKTNLTTIAPVQTDFNGVEIVLDADSDTTLHAETDDQVDLRIAGVDVLKFLQSSGDAVLKPMVDAKDIIFQQFDGNKIFEINDGNFVGVGGNATAPGEIRIFEDSDNGTNYSGFKAAASTTSSVAYQLPAADGSSGTQLTTDGSGVLSWSAAGVTLANDANNRIVTATGSGLNGESGLTYDGSTLALTGAATVSSTLAVSGVTTSNAGVVVDNITIDGQQIDVSSGDLTIDVSGDLILDAGNADIFLKDDGTTYGSLTNTSGNLIIKSGTTTAATFSGANVTFAGTVGSGAITSTGIVTAVGTSVFTNLDISGDVDVDGTTNLDVVDIDGAVDMASTLGVAGVVTANAGVVVDNITIDGTEIDLSSGDLTVDVAGDIILDAAGGDVKFSVAGTQIGNIGSTSSNFFFTSSVQDKDIIFKGNDGGADLTALTIDMSAAGAATFNNAITSGAVITSGAGLVIADTGNIGSASDTDAIAIAANGQVTLTQTLIGTALDISGDIDIDGTSNLDIVDIDGAVNMATTALVTGVLTTTATSVFNGGFTANNDCTINNDDNGVNLTLQSTDDDGSGGPQLLLRRHSGSPADGDVLGRIEFHGQDDNDQQEDLVKLEAIFTDVSNGSEDAQFNIDTKINGTNRSRIEMLPTETVFNEDSVDIDFRIESNADAHIFFVDADNNNILFGDSSNASPAESSTAQHGRISSAGTMQLSASGTPCLAVNRVTNEGTVIDLRQAGGARGSISVAGSTATFNTTSDYRLKENVDYDWDATTRLKQLKPARFNFIEDDTNTLLDGFIAHEVSSIVPIAVKGEKDATVTRTKLIYAANGDLLQEGVEEADWTAGKASGKYASDTTYTATKDEPDYQQLDHSKLVPLLVKTVQELEARIKSLEDA